MSATTRCQPESFRSVFRVQERERLGISADQFTSAALGWINGDPGVLSSIDGRLYAATAFVMAGDSIRAAYRVMNPDKLRGYADVARR